MARLTDVDTLIEKICHDCPYRCHEFCHAVKHIINAPVVDALPVVYAHWICVDDDFGDWQCSSCKEVQRVYDGTPEENNMNFCSACGAMMCEECEQDAED